DDFLASRDAVPRPGDFLASRDAVPRPGDFPASRDAVPRPGDFLASRDAVPRPGDVLAARDEQSLPRNLPSSVGQVGARGNLPASRHGEPPPRGPIPRQPDQPADVGFDPFASDFQQSSSSPLAPLDLGRPDDPGPPTLTPAGALEDESG